LFLNDFEYRETLSYLDHPFLRSALLKELDHWGQETLGVPILNWYCDQIGPGGTSRRLRLILWERADEERMMFHREGLYGYSPEIQRAAAFQFSTLARKYKAHRDYWDPDGFFMAFDTLRDEIQKRVLEKARPHLEALAEGDVWRVMVHFGTIHIFYGTDEQLRQHEADGSCEALRQRCCDIVGPYDSRQVFDDGPPCLFTSHQTLEEKYRGNLFFYFR